MKASRGFTLIELLVVIAIIGILSSVVLASLNTARMKSRDARRLADIKQIQLALALYSSANNSNYPTALSQIVSGGDISVLPTDPLGASAKNAGQYFYAALGSGSACTSYHLAGILEDSTNPALNSAAHAPLISGGACTGSPGDFNGNTADCNNTAGTTCYDVKP